MRARNLKPGFFKNEYLAQCSPRARLLFAALWCLADRCGLLEDRPARIKAEALPYDSCDCDRLLEELRTRGFIVRYQTGGQDLIAIPAFLTHQNPHPHEPASRLPGPPPDVITCNSTGQDMPLTRPASSLNPESGILNQESSAPASRGEANGRQANPPLPEIPACLGTPEFRAAWDEWLSYRRDRRLSCRPQTLQKQLAFLAALGPAGAVASIDSSIRNAWQGIFDPGHERPAAASGKPRPSFRDRLQGKPP